MDRSTKTKTDLDNPAAKVGRIALLSSPRAGSGAGREEIPRLLQLLADDGIRVDKIANPLQLTEWCSEVGGTTESDGEELKRNVIIPAGGDGTITLAASIIAPMGKTSPQFVSSAASESQPLLLPMPLGTENLLARHYGHLGTASQVRDTLLTGRVTTMDLGVVRQANSATHPMLTMVSCGFDADVVRRLHLRRKGHIRRSSYVKPVVDAIRTYRFPLLTVQVLADNGKIERELRCGWAMAFNLPRYGGGLSIEPDAIGNDGLLDVITFSGQTVGSGLRYFVDIQLGRHLRNPDVSRFRASRLRISAAERVHYQIDGDYISRLPIEINTMPGAISLLVPRGK